MTTIAALLAAQRLDWIVPAWNGPHSVRAFFTTRNGDARQHPSHRMDLGSALPDAAEETGTPGDSRRRLRALLPADPVWLTQVHGTGVITVDEGNHRRLVASPPSADAAVTSKPGIPLVVRTADCLPVLLADRAGRVLAVAHAGWRGLAAGVLEATVTAMAAAPKGIVAWIGPAIGPHAYEVGDDVRGTFCAADAGAKMHFAPLHDGKWLADLPGLARRRLAQCGVMDVAGGSWCTVTDAAHFFSWRRDRQMARMGLVAWLADAM